MNMLGGQNCCGSSSNPFESMLAMNPMFQTFKNSPLSHMLKMTPMYKFWHAFHHQMYLADVENGMNSGCCGMNPMMGVHDGAGMGQMLIKMFMNPSSTMNMNPMMGGGMFGQSSCGMPWNNCHCNSMMGCGSSCGNSCGMNHMNMNHGHDLYKMMIQYYGSCAEKLAQCSSGMVDKCKQQCGDSSCSSGSSCCNKSSCCHSEHLKCLESFSNDWAEYFAKFSEKMTWWNEKVSANMKLVAENIKLLKEQHSEYKKNCADSKKSCDKPEKPMTNQK